VRSLFLLFYIDVHRLYKTQFLDVQLSSRSSRTNSTVSDPRRCESRFLPPSLHCNSTRDLRIPAPQPVYCSARLILAISTSDPNHYLLIPRREASLLATHATSGTWLAVRVRQHHLCCLGTPTVSQSHQVYITEVTQGTSICAVHHIIVPLLHFRLWCHYNTPCKFQRYSAH